jgi:cob(I)alamin adenosyltransferase
MVHLYVGDGKGKTTAALGLALRAAGFGKKVYFAQFLKDKKWPCGEKQAVERYGLNILIERFDDQVHPIFCRDKKFEPAKVKMSTRTALTKIAGILKTKRYSLVVLDEILNAWSAGLVSLAQLEKIVKSAGTVELVLTGRVAPVRLVKLADYVSRVQAVKHPFDRGVISRKGVEY